MAAKQSITYALDLEPSGFDPHVNQADEAHRIFMQVFDPLVYQTADHKFHPGLATSWDITPDGKTYTFKLRQGVKFHDGTPFNAQAVKFSFDRIRDPNTKSQLAIDLLGPVDTYEAVDDSTFKITFKTPYPAFLDALSYAWLAPVSPTAVQKSGADFGRNLVGTGPYMWKEWVAKDHITLVKNPDYNWAPDFFKHQGPAYLDTVTVRFVDEPSTRSATLETGEIDITYDPPATDVERLKANQKLKVSLTPQPGTSEMMMLDASKAPTDQLPVRQAIAYAVDKDAIDKTLHAGLFMPSFSPLNRATFGYDKSVEGNYSFQPDRAKQLLDDAGWKVGPDGIRQKDGQPLKLQWVSLSCCLHPQIGEQVQAMLRDVGIDVSIDVAATFPNYSAALRDKQHNMTIGGWIVSDPGILTSVFHTRNMDANNRGKVSLPALDQVLDKADVETNADQRAALYGQAQKLIMDNAFVVPLRDFAEILVTNSKLDGLTFDPRGSYIWLYDAYLTQ
jgi:peptide/nickel transport system substrate-binding protein